MLSSLSGTGRCTSHDFCFSTRLKSISSIASTDIATAAVVGGARLITHLFNAMPQLHHRDPSIIGMLGASPHLAQPPTSPTSPVGPTFQSIGAPLSRSGSTSSLAKRALAAHGDGGAKATSEAFDELVTPPQTPILAPIDTDLHLRKGVSVPMSFERPFYELIVDGIHSHPNSVRVSIQSLVRGDYSHQIPTARIHRISRRLYPHHGW